MMLVFTLLIAALLLDIAVSQLPKKYSHIRTLLAISSIGTLGLLSFIAFESLPAIFAGLITLCSVYRTVNLLRALKGRMHMNYVRAVCLRTAAWLASYQLAIYICFILWRNLRPETATVWLVIAGLQAAGAIVILYTIRGHVRHANQALSAKSSGDTELPSITVAIAARNETDSLLRCLEALLTSNYPKLEILVLDDCSQDRRTSEVISSFAHDGVRFIPGTEPSETWLARNQAYQTLADSANGDYILFCSTSVRVQPDSIRKLVSYALAKHKTMVSLLPRSGTAAPTLAELVQAAWELLPPRRWLGRPPVSTACWLVEADALRGAGSFTAVSRMVTPEAYFASSQTAHDGYSYLVGAEGYGVTSLSEAGDQSDKFIRSSYPALHRRPEIVLVVGLLLAGMAVLPVIGLLTAEIWLHSVLVACLSLSTLLILLAACWQLAALQSRARLTIAGYPVAALWIILRLHQSMYKYEFSEVLWKDRNICIPVMHVVSHLPDDV